MLVKEDDGVYYCPWWRNGDNIANFDDMSDTVLVNAMRDNGFVVALTYDSLDEITVNLLGETAETLVWSDTEKEFDKRIPVWQNAQANMVYRAFTWQDNTNIFAVIDDNSGELCVWTDGENHTFYFKVTPDNYNGATVEFERLADHPEMETQVTGLYDIEVFECSYDGWGDTVTIANETDDGLFIVKVDQDGYYRTNSATIPVWAGQLIVKKLSAGDEYEVVLLGDDRLLVVDELDDFPIFFVRYNGTYIPAKYDPNMELIKNWVLEYGIYETTAVENMGTYEFSVLGEQYSLTQNGIMPSPLG